MRQYRGRVDLASQRAVHSVDNQSGTEPQQAGFGFIVEQGDSCQKRKDDAGGGEAMRAPGVESGYALIGNHGGALQEIMLARACRKPDW